MQSNITEEKLPRQSNPSSTPDLFPGSKLAGTDLEDNQYHTGFLRRVTVLLSRYGIETHG